MKESAPKQFKLNSIWFKKSIFIFFVFFGDFHQRAKAADTAQHFRAHGAFGKRFDVFDQLITCVDIDTGIAVAERRLIVAHVFTFAPWLLLPETAKLWLNWKNSRHFTAKSLFRPDHLGKH